MTASRAKNEVRVPVPEGVLSRGPRRVVAVGGALAVLGLAIAATEPSDEGMVIILAALVTLIYGVHALGRLGPDRE